MDTKAEDEFEAQFVYNNELIHIKQITSPDEVPQLCAPNLATNSIKSVGAVDASVDTNISTITSDCPGGVQSGSIVESETESKKSLLGQNVDDKVDEIKNFSSSDEDCSRSGDRESRDKGILNTVKEIVVEESPEQNSLVDMSASLLTDQVSSADGISDPSTASSVLTSPLVNGQDSRVKTLDRNDSAITVRDEQRESVITGSDGAVTGSEGVIIGRDGAGGSSDGAANISDGTANLNDGAANVSDGVANVSDCASNGRDGGANISDGAATAACNSIDGTAGSTPPVGIPNGDQSWDTNIDAVEPRTDIVDGSGRNARPGLVKFEVLIKEQEFDQLEAVERMTSANAASLEPMEALADRQEKPCNPQQKRPVEEEVSSGRWIYLC